MNYYEMPCPGGWLIFLSRTCRTSIAVLLSFPEADRSSGCDHVRGPGLVGKFWITNRGGRKPFSCPGPPRAQSRNHLVK